MNQQAATLIKRFIDADVQQAAFSLEEMNPEEAAPVLAELPVEAVVRCLEHMRPAAAAAVLKHLFPEPARAIFDQMKPDHATDVFRSLSKEDRKRAMASLSKDRKMEIQEFLAYPEDSAGRLMKTDVVSFHKDLKIREAVARLKGMPITDATTYTYVVDSNNKLIGILNMRDVLVADYESIVESVMRREVFSVSAFMDREELVHLASQKPYIWIPVVDAEGRLVGAIRPGDLLESSQEEATEDLQLLFGSSAEERSFSPTKFKVAKRLPWLTFNLATAFLAAGTVALFEDLIGRIAVLAVFLPVVAGQGGNAGTQSLVVVLRGLVMREVRPHHAWSLIAREAVVGLINGVAIGMITALVAWLWHKNPFLGVVIGLAMVVNMVAAGLAGAAIPIAMKRLGFDPAQSSGIFLTTITDVVGFFSFLGFAALFQARLV